MAGKKKTRSKRKSRSTSKKPPTRKAAKTSSTVSKVRVPRYKKDTYVAVENKKSPDRFTVY